MWVSDVLWDANGEWREWCWCDKDEDDDDARSTIGPKWLLLRMWHFMSDDDGESDDDWTWVEMLNKWDRWMESVLTCHQTFAHPLSKRFLFILFFRECSFSCENLDRCEMTSIEIDLGWKIKRNWWQTERNDDGEKKTKLRIEIGVKTWQRAVHPCVQCCVMVVAYSPIFLCS